VPFLVRGRDELSVHDMWNSNSQISWLLARAGIDVDSINPLRGGRAPGSTPGWLRLVGIRDGPGLRSLGADSPAISVNGTPAKQKVDEHAQ
jgi:hypothetical protein